MRNPSPLVEPPPETPPSPSPRPAKRKVSSTLLNFWLDAALLTSVAVLIWISAMMQFVFPAPTLADGWSLWGLSYNAWRDVQFGALCVCGLLAIEHVVLHWNWVCGVIATKLLKTRNKPDEAIQAVYGVGAFIGLMMVFLAGLIVAVLTVIAPSR